MNLAKTYSDLPQKISLNLISRISGLGFKRTTPVYFQYDNITLKMFVEISNDGDFKRLLISGAYNADTAIQEWEEIIKRNSEVNGDFQWHDYFELFRGYLTLQTKHLKTRALLFSLAASGYNNKNEEHVAKVSELASMGIKIDVTSGAGFEKSISLGFRKSDNFVSKYESKRLELEKLVSKSKEKGSKRETFDTIWANLSVAAAPMVISEDITLSKFNELKKVLKERNKQTTKANGR